MSPADARRLLVPAFAALAALAGCSDSEELPATAWCDGFPIEGRFYPVWTPDGLLAWSENGTVRVGQDGSQTAFGPAGARGILHPGPHGIGLVGELQPGQAGLGLLDDNGGWVWNVEREPSPGAGAAVRSDGAVVVANKPQAGAGALVIDTGGSVVAEIESDTERWLILRRTLATDSGYVLFGRMTDGCCFGGEGQAVALAVAPNGQEQWRVELPDLGYSEFGAAARTGAGDAGGFVACGNRADQPLRDDQAWAGEPFCAGISEEGDLLWTTPLYVSESRLETSQVWDVETSDDGVTVLWTPDRMLGGPDGAAWLARVGPDGALTAEESGLSGVGLDLASARNASGVWIATQTALYRLSAEGCE